MKKEFYDFVFVVLAYRNSSDLEDFFQSLVDVEGTFKVIVVNSYYDDESLRRIKEVSMKYDAAFISAENKGYGTGNNIGIKYAIDNYEFRYITVCNPDILVNKFSAKDFEFDNSVIVPSVICGRGVDQNPFLSRRIALRDKLLYKGYISNSRICLFFATLVTRISKVLFILWKNIFNRNNSPVKVYAGHGSCLIFPYAVIKDHLPIFDENIFLFHEEQDIANRFRKENISFYYCPKIHIYHKEDGSMDMVPSRVMEGHSKDSFIYVYNKWHNN